MGFYQLPSEALLRVAEVLQICRGSSGVVKEFSFGGGETLGSVLDPAL